MGRLPESLTLVTHDEGEFPIAVKQYDTLTFTLDHHPLDVVGWDDSFCPRPYDFDPESVPAPYAHSNVMSDEVLFYSSEEFMSRRGSPTDR